MRLANSLVGLILGATIPKKIKADIKDFDDPFEWRVKDFRRKKWTAIPSLEFGWPFLDHRFFLSPPIEGSGFSN